jgi:hypothetical protein
MPAIPATEEARDQEDLGSKPAQANSSTRPYLKKILINQSQTKD